MYICNVCRRVELVSLSRVGMDIEHLINSLSSVIPTARISNCSINDYDKRAGIAAAK